MVHSNWWRKYLLEHHRELQLFIGTYRNGDIAVQRLSQANVDRSRGRAEDRNRLGLLGKFVGRSCLTDVDAVSDGLIIRILTTGECKENNTESRSLYDLIEFHNLSSLWLFDNRIQDTHSLAQVFIIGVETDTICTDTTNLNIYTRVRVKRIAFELVDSLTVVKCERGTTGRAVRLEIGG